MNNIKKYLQDIVSITNKINETEILQIINLILEVKGSGGRLFFLGVGGSAANCSHAVNDFRKIVGIESYSPCDNVSELTARINDDGWNTVFSSWLQVSKLNKYDGVFIFSVGGGDEENNISVNLIEAIKYSRKNGAKVLGIVGRADGFTAKNADACVVIPNISKETLTPYAEAFQAVIWHLLVSHPLLKSSKTKWETINDN